MELTDGFGSFAGFAAMLVVISELVFGKLVPLRGQAAKYASWALGALIGVAASYFKLGFFADVVSPGVLDLFYVEGALIGFLAALLANGVFGVNAVKVILEVLKVRSPKPLI